MKQVEAEARPASAQVWEPLEEPKKAEVEQPKEEVKVEFSKLLADMKMEKYEEKLVEAGVRTMQ
jgi:hypothetical protein